jgi:hypothetical protein
MDKKSMVVIALSVVVMLFILISTGGEQAVSELPMSQDTLKETEMETEEGGATQPPQQMKIDVRVACESALMYTSFTDGAGAEAFVADCVDGKHPEVIERYIQEMGVDGALI